MPTKKCTSKGKSGYKFGNKGKCFTGTGAKSKADRQGKAIKSNQKR